MMRWTIGAVLIAVGALAVFLGVQYQTRVAETPIEPAMAVPAEAPAAPTPPAQAPQTVVHKPEPPKVAPSEPPQSPAPAVTGSTGFGDLWKSVSKDTTLEEYSWGVSGDDDLLDGGADIDTLEYYGNRADYEIARSPLSPAGTNTIFLTRKKLDNSLDIVFNVEIVVFADQTIRVEDLFK